MIGRRALLAGLTALPLAQARAALPIPASNRLAFRIIRKGSTIGEHSVDFAHAGDALTVVAADIVVGIGPIAFFRYSHRATVQWQAGQVVSIPATTNDDGTPRHMSARRDEGGLVVKGSNSPRYVAPPRSLPGTHWNPAMLDAPFINTEDGRLMSPRVMPLGMEKVEVTGGSIEAQHYAMRGDANLDDLTPSWVGLRFSAKDGSEVRYLRA